MDTFTRSCTVLLSTLFLVACGDGGGGSGSSGSAPSAPATLSAVASSAQVALSWDSVSSADQYKVYWHDSGVTTSDWTLLDSTTNTAMNHTGLTTEVTYSYRVSGVNDNGEGDYASTSATTHTEPAAPSYVRSTLDAGGTVVLTWPDIAGVTGYRVYYDTNGTVDSSDDYIDAALSTSANFTVEDGAVYYFSVAGVNETVVGNMSDSISVVGNREWGLLKAGYGVVANHAIAHDSSGGVYVSVGDQGLISRSTDGANWSVQHAGLNGFDLMDVAWTGNRFVAIGYRENNNNLGVVVTSSDGITWTVTEQGIGGGANAIAWNGSRLVAVGYQFAAYSDDEGDSWNTYSTMSGASLTGLYMSSIIWDGSQFIVGEIGYVLLSSDGDDDTWSGSLISGSSYPLIDDLAYSGTTYVIATTDGLYSSSDGSSYTIREGKPAWDSTGYFYFRNVVWDSANSTFIAVGSDTSTSDSGTLFTSSDGITWSEAVTGLNNLADGLFNDGTATLVFGDRGFMQRSTDASNWSDIETQADNNLRDIVAVGSNGWALAGTGALLAVSADGDNWSWVSRNCSTWTTSDTWSGITYGDNKYLTVGGEGCIMTSGDGSSWVERDSYVADNLNDVLWDGAQFVAVGRNGVILTSPHGMTWTQQTSPVTESLIQLTLANGLYVAVGNTGTILTSADASNWTQQASPVSAHLRSIVYSDGLFVASGGSGKLLNSSDGINWTDVSSGINTTSLLRTLCADSTGFWVFSDAGNQYTSTDGANWQQAAPLPVTGVWSCDGNASDRLMAVGLGGLVMSH